jgi:hypothetical protein
MWKNWGMGVLNESENYPSCRLVKLSERSDYDDSLEAINQARCARDVRRAEKRRHVNLESARAARDFFAWERPIIGSTRNFSFDSLDAVKSPARAQRLGASIGGDVAAVPGLSNVPYLAASVSDSDIARLERCLFPDVEPRDLVILAEVRKASVKIRVETEQARRVRQYHALRRPKGIPKGLSEKLNFQSRTDKDEFLTCLRGLSLGDLQDKGGVRGKIRELSEKSRMNLQSLAYELSAMGIKPDIMVTLTYPGDWASVAGEGRAIKRHLAAFRRRIERYLKKRDVGCSALWFLEFQKRGAPHWHLIFWGEGLQDSCLQALREKVARDWASIVKHPCQFERAKHRKAGTRTEKMRKGHFGYVSKYASKTEQKEVPEQFQNVGRFWGLWNFKMPSAESHSLKLTQAALDNLMCKLAMSVYRASERFSDRLLKLIKGNRRVQPSFTVTVFGQGAVRAVLDTS